MAGIAEEALADDRDRGHARFSRFIEREPHGVVLVIAPWNYPYLTAINTIVPALIAGNRWCSSTRPRPCWWASGWPRAFPEAGVPDDVFQNVFLDHDGTEALIAGVLRLHQLHRLGRRRQGDRARSGGHLHRARARARRQGSGLCDGGRRSRRGGRHPDGRRDVQRRPVLLRDRADLCRRARSTTFVDRPSAWAEATCSAIRSIRRPRSGRWPMSALPRRARQIEEAIAEGAEGADRPVAVSRRRRRRLLCAAGAGRREPRHARDARGELRPRSSASCRRRTTTRR